MGGPTPCGSRESITFVAGATVTRQWGQGPGDRDVQLPQAAARRCRHAWAVPLIASNTAGCSVGSLRVAGLISRIHLSRKTGKSDSVGTGEARCAEVSETLLCKRQRDEILLGTSLVLQHLSIYSMAEAMGLPKTQQCPVPVQPLQPPAGRRTGSFI